MLRSQIFGMRKVVVKDKHWQILVDAQQWSLECTTFHRGVMILDRWVYWVTLSKICTFPVKQYLVQEIDVWKFWGMETIMCWDQKYQALNQIDVVLHFTLPPTFGSVCRHNCKQSQLQAYKIHRTVGPSVPEKKLTSQKMFKTKN